MPSPTPPRHAAASDDDTATMTRLGAPSGGSRRRGRGRYTSVLALVLAAVTLTGTDILAAQATDTSAPEATTVATAAPEAPVGTAAPEVPAEPTAAEPTTATAWPTAEPVPAVELGGAPASMEAEGSSSSSSAAGTGSATGSATSTGSSGWLSGAAGGGVGSGAFAAWRGSAVDIIGTWSDNNEAMVELWQVMPGGEYGSWDGPLDIAIGAIGPGETWRQAAAGAYDARWAESLTNLAAARGDASGTTFIRFAHEMNGNWYPWAVDSSERTDFIAGWQRFRALQQSIFPDAQLVFCLNRESVGSGFDWRQSWPGAGQVDVLGVDYYNQWPYAGTAAQFQAGLTLSDQWGGPKGLQAYADFARSQGIPLAVPEWSGVADQGDSPAYIEGMRTYFEQHSGTGPGQIAYEILFDIDGATYDGNFILSSSSTRLPLSAEAYRRFF